MVECPYCNQPAKLVTGKEVYPHLQRLHARKVWLCRPCDAYVGCHATGTGDVPLGTLANAALRRARNTAHKAFDPIWERKHMTRQEAYAWLAESLDLPVEKTHIALFDETACAQVVKVCRMRLLRRLAG